VRGKGESGMRNDGVEGRKKTEFKEKNARKEKKCWYYR
jgi:hypothetical protein